MISRGGRGIRLGDERIFDPLALVVVMQDRVGPIDDNVVVGSQWREAMQRRGVSRADIAMLEMAFSEAGRFPGHEVEDPFEDHRSAAACPDGLDR